MKRKRLFILALAAALLLSLCACEQEKLSAQSTNFANAVMGGNVFAYRDGFIYFSDEMHMYEYDTVSGNTARLGAITSYLGYSLVVTDEYISYTVSGSDSVHYITRDGKQSGILFDRKGGYFFLDENTWYFTDNKKYDEDQRSVQQLWSRDAETGEETLLYEAEIIGNYFLDAEYIYVVEAAITGYDADGSAAVDCWLLRSPRGQIAFEKVDTGSVKPVKVFADGEDLYILQKKDFQIWHCADGVVTPLPVNADVYQVFDGNLLYLKYIHEEGRMVKGLLKLYNMKTGEETLFSEHAFDVAFFEQRYITYSVQEDEESYYRWYIYDLQTGETKEMVKPV